MHIILGATGHVGSEVTENLLKKKENVLLITRDSHKTKKWERQGAKVASVDVLDTDALRHVFDRGHSLFLLNPPGDPSKNSIEEERETLHSILMALEDSSIERIVAASTYGAQAGNGIGDLGILYEMETELKNLFRPYHILRSAYYMTNWDSSLPSALEEGVVYSFFPAEFKIPMVSPKDVGKLAAELLLDKEGMDRPHYIEGPEEYTPADVAVAFSEHLRRPVKVVTIPQDKWIEAMMKQGFSKESAASMAAMTDVVLNNKFEKPRAPDRGRISLNDHIAALIEEKGVMIQELSNSF
ncbi:hypothetical protein AZI86_01235 [Bdellovibrio bacteriovorus]|uniref:NmrA-like domain-containing protein n=1 Tax=Bdellovibrio bacteriovorus TaxID=959 RepID=A0A150WMW1_BDEBC|nr:NAD(P)H-binding protein [Bdellovibrio bacteriovorus]KYG65728.1 hypothetical protein AZI86_01235 [Bdellovibrio bacteriovorus]